MPDWLIAVGATLGVIVALAGGCALGTWVSRAWQAHQDTQVWK